MTETKADFEFRLGSVNVNPTRLVLSGGEIEVRLEPKVMSVLLALAEAEGEVVVRNDLIDQVWGVQHGGDESLTRAMSILRGALRQFEPNTAFIETIPRTGYRLTVPVERAVRMKSAPSKSTGDERARADREIPMRQPKQQISKTLIYLSLSLFAVLAIAVVSVSNIFNSKTSNAPPRVAVLPLSFEIPDQRSARIAGGLSDQIVDLLTRINGMDVIGRTTSFSSALDQLSAEEIGETINVDYLVDGNIIAQGDIQKTSIRLVDTDDGSVIWSRAYDIDTTVDGMFELQQLIATDLAGALEISIGIDNSLNLGPAETTSLEAYDALLRARNAAEQANNERAAQFYRLATELDPNYAKAWAELAITTGSTAWNAGTNAEAKARFAEGRRLARHAIRLDPTLATAKSSLGALLYPNDEWLEAGKLQTQAIAESRTSSTITSHALMLLRAGQIMNAESLAMEALELNPLDPSLYSLLANISAVKGQPENADAYLARLRELTRHNSANWDSLNWVVELQQPRSMTEISQFIEKLMDADTRLAQILTPVHKAMPEKALALDAVRGQFETTVGLHPARNEILAAIAAQLGDHELALRYWSIELDEKPLRMLRLWGPLYGEMRQLPEYSDLMIELNIIPFWDEFGWPDRCLKSDPSEFRCF